MEQDSCLVSKVALWKNIITFIFMIIIFENYRLKNKQTRQITSILHLQEKQAKQLNTLHF